MAQNSTPKRGRGRPSKGTRVELSGYVPEDQGAIYEQRRQELGLSMADYVALRMAQAEGLPVPEYISNVIDINRRRPTGGVQGGSAMAI
ncbi:MAG: hypothetical protein L0G87_00565 [Renibacterium salmoninarum]|nr:hypothetical protein [Renibacterium salmoninarum]